MRLFRRSLFLSLLVFLSVAVPGRAQSRGLAAQSHSEPVPAGLAAPVAGQIAAGGVRATAGTTTLDFWFVKALPVSSGAAPAPWSGVAEGTLVGVVRLNGDFRDVRGRIIRAGLFTLRYGIQPENGDHLGVSPFREFLLLIPAALDTQVAPRGHDGTIDLSKRTAGGSHPAVWSIDPPSTTEPLLSRRKNELELESVVVEVPVARDGKKAGILRFGIALLGKIEA
jgi:hypothetical protein